MQSICNVAFTVSWIGLTRRAEWLLGENESIDLRNAAFDPGGGPVLREPIKSVAVN